MAELTPPADREPDRPYPPGDYPVVVVGSGPGAIQVAYSLAGSASTMPSSSAPIPAPGGMFRRWPFFQRLLSWTKPYAPVERDSPAYERYDWNSLLADDPAHRALMPDLMDGSSYFPSRPEMERNLATFAERDRDADPLRLPLDGDASRGRAGRRAVRPRDDRRRVPREGARLRGRRGRAVLAADARDRARRPLRRHPTGRDVRRPAGLHHGQAELGLRARDRAPAVGPPDLPVLAVAGQAVGQHAVAGRRPGTLRPAVRGSRPRRRRDDPRRVDRRDRPSATTVDAPSSSRSGRPTAATSWRSRSTRSSPRPGSSPRSWTCRTLGVTTFGQAGCRPRRRTGRARRCPASTSPGRSARARPA